MKHDRSLKGYRIGALINYDFEGSVTRRKWNQIKLKSTGASTVDIFEAPRTHDEFTNWWRNAMDLAREDNVTLVVVDVDRSVFRGFDRSKVWHESLNKIEEEEFYTGIEHGVRFTKLDSLVETVSKGKSPVDLWGDEIERGGSAYIFHGDIFALDSSIVSVDPAIMKDIILNNGGIIFDGKACINPNAKRCYIITDDVLGCANRNPQFEKYSRVLGVDTVPVTPTWATICDKADVKCDPKEYPILYQPCPPMHPLDSRFIISVTGFTGPIRQAIISLLEAMRATHTAGLTPDNTHLICMSCGSAKYEKAIEWGVHRVTLDWLFHVRRRGYKLCCESQFPHFRKVPSEIIISKIKNQTSEHDTKRKASRMLNLDGDENVNELPNHRSVDLARSCSSSMSDVSILQV